MNGNVHSAYLCLFESVLITLFATLKTSVISFFTSIRKLLDLKKTVNFRI